MMNGAVNEMSWYFRELEKSYHNLAEEAKAYKDGSLNFFKGMEMAYEHIAEELETVLFTD